MSRCAPTRPAALHADIDPARPVLAARARATSTTWCRCCGPRPRARTTTARWRSAASTCATWCAEHGSPAYVLDEADFRSRARAFRDGVRRLRRLLRRQGVPLHDRRALGRRGGAVPRRLLRRRADASRCGPASTPPGSATTATTRPIDELRRAVEVGVGRIVVDSFDEIERLGAGSPTQLGATGPVMVRVTAGVEAHTHEYIATAHEDQKFGFSISSGDALEAVRRGARRRRASSCSGLHSPHRLADLRHLRASRSPRGACSRCTPGCPTSSASSMPELDLGGGFGIAYTTQDDPSDPAQLATELTKIVEHECRALGVAGAARCRSSPAGRSSGRRCARSTRSAPSSRSSSTPARCAPTSRSTAG